MSTPATLRGPTQPPPRLAELPDLKRSVATGLCWGSAVPFPGSAPGANRTPCRILSSADNLDAQEQRIYQLQTKQRERQAELEQKCSRIQWLRQDVEASHQLQEEAQKQVEELWERAWMNGCPSGCFKKSYNVSHQFHTLGDFTEL